MGALSLLLIVIGAVLRFATTKKADGFDLQVIGMILMVVGAVGLIFSVVQGRLIGFSRTRQVSQDGRTVVEKEHTL